MVAEGLREDLIALVYSDSKTPSLPNYSRIGTRFYEAPLSCGFLLDIILPFRIIDSSQSELLSVLDEV